MRRSQRDETRFQYSWNTKHYSPSIGEEFVPPRQLYAQDRKWTWSTRFLARQEFTASESKKYTKETHAEDRKSSNTTRKTKKLREHTQHSTPPTIHFTYSYFFIYSHLYLNSYLPLNRYLPLWRLGAQTFIITTPHTAQKLIRYSI